MNFTKPCVYHYLFSHIPNYGTEEEAKKTAENLVFMPGLCCEVNGAQAPLETGTGIWPETVPAIDAHPVFTRQNIDTLRHGPPGQPE